MAQAQESVSLRQLAVFETVARLKSIGRAAASLNRSQPAITQSLSSLEAAFGVLLFERGHSGSYVTDLGRILFDRTERLFGLIRQGLEEFFGGPQSETVNLNSLAGKITKTHIRCLLAISENMSFVQAARSLGISQPSLNRAARDLQRLLRRAVYFHGPRGITTTEQGRALARRWKLAVRELDYAQDEINAQQGIITSRIVIGTLSTSGSFVLARAIDQFLTRYPSAEVRVLEEPYEQLLDHLRSGNIDFLFSVLRRPDWITDVAETVLFEEPYVVVMRPHHPLSKATEVGIDKLADYDWIVPGPSTPRYLAFERLFAKAKKKPTSKVSTTSRGLIRSLLTDSDRLTLLTRHEALLEEKLGVLKIVPAQVRLPRRSYGVTTRSEWRPTNLQQTFFKMLVSHSEATPADAFDT